MSRWLSWMVMAGVLIVALAVGATGDRAPRTPAARVDSLASEVRCPTCRSLSVAESDAKAAQAIRDEIATRVTRGETDAQIRGYLVSRYGKDILLRPEASGVAGLVWAVPVAAGVFAVGGLVAVFQRWRGQRLPTPTDEDRALVQDALGR